MKGERGSVLIFVLVLTVVLAYIASLIANSRLQASLSTANAARRTAEDLAIQSAANAVTAAWALAGYCSTNTDLGVICSGTGACNCDCTLTSGASVKASAGVGASCRLRILP